MQFEHSVNMTRTAILETERLSIELQVKDNHPFIHLNIFKWSPSTLKEMLAKIGDVKYLLRSFGYPYVFGALERRDAKLEKLYKKLGLLQIHTSDTLVVFVLRTEETD